MQASRRWQTELEAAAGGAELRSGGMQVEVGVGVGDAAGLLGHPRTSHAALKA